MSAYLEKVTQALQPGILQFTQYQGEVSLHVSPEQLLPILTALKEQHGFNYLTDIGTIDHYTEEGRFEVFYNIFNLTENQRIRVKCRVSEENPEVPTCVPLWPSAGWHEREAFDMMGIRFTGNPDMRRIYMPEDFEYYPHRKEFPLIGIPGTIQMPEKDPPKGYK